LFRVPHAVATKGSASDTLTHEINTFHEGIGAAMKKNVESELGLVRISLGAGGFGLKSSSGFPAYLKPGQTATFETDIFQLHGDLRLIRLGGHPKLEFVSASTNGGKDPISKKQLEDGFPVQVAQKVMITVKNTDEGRLLWAHPLFHISSDLGNGREFDCLASAESIEYRQGFIHLATEQRVNVTLEAPFLMKAKRVFIHSFSADEEYLMVEDIRLGKNSVFVNSRPIAAAHFSERFSPLLSFGILQPGQIFSVVAINHGPSMIAFAAELEGQKIELP
jgi:uncharacterized protein (DUF952 family)